jgi:tRNA 2-selenouridine synthase
MTFVLSNLSDLAAAPFDEVIDVRSPREYAEDAVPGSVNLPVLSDAERELVGTVYKQESPFLARKIGAALIAKNIAGHLDTHFRDKSGGYRPLVYCWRGGMRSGAMVTILGQIGWRAELLSGGYKSYRKCVVRMLYEQEPSPTAQATELIVIDGNTGTAKTEILKRLAALNLQILDLEGLAVHRGSLFGAMDAPQPPQRAFDSSVAARWAAFDPNQPVFVEAESSRIGSLNLPKVLWSEMRRAPRIYISAERGPRAAYLSETYADITANHERLVLTLEKLRHYHPTERIKHWHELVQSGDMCGLAHELTEHHYDPKYARQRARSPFPELGTIRLESFEPGALDAAAHAIARLVRLPR